MRPRPTMIAIATALMSLPTGAVGQADGLHGPVASTALFEQVREVFDEEHAHGIVAFVERFFRLPGNRGFEASLDRVIAELESAGFVPGRAGSGPLTWRIEQRPLSAPAWDPVEAGLWIEGRSEPLLRFVTNRNLIAINSWSTPRGGVSAPLVYVGAGSDEEFAGRDVTGAIVLGDAPASRLYRAAVLQRGAAGVLSWSMPDYNRPAEHPHVISFASIPMEDQHRRWALRLSLAARDSLLAALETGPVRVRAEVSTRIYPSRERLLVAEILGSRRPEERFVYSAHVQEPGANDNASGVGCQAEIAHSAAELIQSGTIPHPERTITFLWGDEIGQVRWYLEADSTRARQVRWGMSLDMVGEDTEKTGGTFLIEKMPDPSAVWTRGQDRHTEWGGRPLTEDALFPHYFNDFVLGRCMEQAAATGWEVRTNPYEGGSDHVPFLRAGIPGLLLWHFTDVYYHTDGDRIEMVSAETLRNVGVSALVSGLTLASADSVTEAGIRAELMDGARRRLQTEAALTREALAGGGDRAEQVRILRVWAAWYADALRTTGDIAVGEDGTDPDAEQAAQTILQEAEVIIRGLGRSP